MVKFRLLNDCAEFPPYAGDLARQGNRPRTEPDSQLSLSEQPSGEQTASHPTRVSGTTEKLPSGSGQSTAFAEAIRASHRFAFESPSVIS